MHNTQNTLTNLLRRLNTLEMTVRRITQVDTKPRLILPPAGSIVIEYVIDSLATAGSSSPYNGLIVATATLKSVGANGDVPEDEIEVIDHGGCTFDLADMEGFTGWAFSDAEFLSLASGASSGEMTPKHYAAFTRCCAADTGTYASLE